MQQPAALCQKRTHALQQNDGLLEHLVGEREHAGRNSEGVRFGGLEINNQLEFGRLHHRQLGRLFTLEDAVNIRRRSTPLVKHVSPIGC